MRVQTCVLCFHFLLIINLLSLFLLHMLSSSVYHTPFFKSLLCIYFFRLGLSLFACPGLPTLHTSRDTCFSTLCDLIIAAPIHSSPPLLW